MSTNPTIHTTETTLPPEQDHISVVDRQIGSSGINGNSHYIPLDECQCTICTEYFINAVETNCHHRFCNFCIHRWFRSHGRRQCPTCRCNVTHLNPLPSLDISIQRMILSLSGDQIQERERIRSRRHHTDPRQRGRNIYSTSSRITGISFLPVATEELVNSPVLTLPTARTTNTNGNVTPGNNVTSNTEPIDTSGANVNGNRTFVDSNNSNRRYIDEMTDTMNEYEYHLARAQAAHRRMVQARSDYEIQENRLHTLFNRFVTLSAAAEANYDSSDRHNLNHSGNDGLLDSDLDDFSVTPNSRPSTLGLGAMNNQRFPTDNYSAFDNQRPTRGQLRSPWGIRPSLITPPYTEPSRIDISVATTERLEPVERINRFGRIPNTNFRENTNISVAATPLTSTTPRRPTLNDVILLRNDITRNANLTRASYDRHVSLRRAMGMNRRRLDQLRDERNRFQVQVDRLEAQTIGTTATNPNSTALRENDITPNRENESTANRENRRSTHFNGENDSTPNRENESTTNRENRRSTHFNRTSDRTDVDLPRSVANANTTRLADEVNDMWEHFRARILRGQQQGEDSDSDDADQTSRDNIDTEELPSPALQEEGDVDSDPELRIEFRTPTMTLKMSNFSQK